MLWVYGHYKYFNFFQLGDRLYTSESDVLTYEDGPRTESVKMPCYDGFYYSLTRYA